MTNKEISDLFYKVAIALKIQNEKGNKFRVIAYERASEEIKNLASPIDKLWKEGRLDEVPGLGKSMVSHVNEIFTVGKSAHLESILREIPESVYILLSVPGMGPKRAYRIVQEFHLTDPKTVIGRIETLAKNHEIAKLDGFGEKSEADIIEAIGKYKKGSIKENRILLSLAYDLAANVVEFLKKCKYTKNVMALGSLRRMRETIGDIDIAVATDHPDEVVEYFLTYPDKSDIIEKGPTGASIHLGNGRQVDLRVVKPTQWGSMIQYFTGSKGHNVRLRELALKKGLSLNEYGLKPLSKQAANGAIQKLVEFKQEEKLYEYLGIPWVTPELREDRGEIEAATQSKLPNLVEQKDIKGDLHIHTSFDIETSHDLGQTSLEELQKSAQALGYEYIGLSDHNPSHSKHSKKEIISIMKRRKLYYEHIYESNKSTRVNILISLETDILPNGDLALPDEAFEYIDGTIVSIHSEFRLTREKMTERVLKGLSHPKARILAHPSGRLLTGRIGFELDWDEVFEFCKKNDKAIEINASPYRLDLTDVLVKEAIGKGVKMIINTDSHSKDSLSDMKFGIAVARRGWAKKDDILNTLSYNEFRTWFQQRG